MEKTEDKLQSDAFLWSWNTFPEYRTMFFAIPNGGKRSPREASKLKLTGTVPGIPDTMFQIDGKTFLFEFKIEKGVLSSEQILIRLNRLKNGFKYFIIRDVDQFKQIYLYLIMTEIKKKFTRLEEIHGIAFFGMDQKTLKYQNKIFAFLYSMEIDAFQKISDICEKENISLFTESVKKFIIFEMDQAEGFVLEFNENYTSFRKFESYVYKKNKVKK